MVHCNYTALLNNCERAFMPEIELHCECPRCGKSVYHTIRWLRDNTSVKCERCGNEMPSTGILRDNSKAVLDSDESERRGPRA